MHRWLYFAVSCTAAIGIACGGDDGPSGGIDARTFDAGPGAADARTFDAPPVSTPDARTFDAPPVVTVDARIFDAPPVVTIDAGPVVDAAPQIDATPACTSDPGCTAAGVNVCVDNDTVGGCTQVQTGCFKVTTTNDCTSPQVCSGGTCGCPAPVAAANAAPGLGCAQLNAQTCSADGRAVLTCVTAGACNVWSIANPTADTCDTADGTGDGLTCVSNQCVCPQNPTSIFYANPVVDRSARPGLVRRGTRFPALCTFDTMTLALAAAARPEFAETGRAVASKDNPSAANLGQPARFENETFPWTIPTGRIMTTVDDPISGVGGTGNFNPSDFVVVVNNHGDGGTASVTVEGTNVRGDLFGGSVRGLTFVEGNCGGDVCELPGTAILVRNHGTRASTFRALDSVLVEGGGGAVNGDAERTGNITVTAGTAAGTLNVTIDGTANANIFGGLTASAGDYWIGLAGGPAGLTGFFLVESFTDGHTAVVRSGGAAAAPAFAGTLVLTDARDWDTGIRVTNSNATITTAVARNFASFGGDEDRVALLIDSDFSGNAANGVEADVVSVQGALFNMNDTAIRVDGDDGNLNVALGPFASPGGPVNLRVNNSFNAGIDMDDGTVTATGVQQAGTFSSGDPAVGFWAHGSADVTLSGVSATGNAEHGLLYFQNDNSLVDTGSSFSGNGSDGVNVAGSGAVEAKAQPIDEAHIELRGSAMNSNGRYGLNVVGEAITVWVRGGTIELNEEDGIHQSGDSLLVTNGQAGDAVLNVQTNGDSGLEAGEGEVRLFTTAFTGNGTNNHCGPTEDQAEDAVIINGNATMHAVGINVNANRGGGIRISTDGDNTISGSAIQNNLGIDTCGSNETDASLRGGVHVLLDSNLSFEGEGSSIQGNARTGIYNSGSIDATGAPLTVLGNGWTGIFVATEGTMTQTGGTVNGNGVANAANLNDGVNIRGDYDATDTVIRSNRGNGVFVNLQNSDTQVLLTNTAIHNNTGNGVALSSAPGSDAANVDELSPVTDDQYGFRIRTTPSSSAKVPVYSNGGAGFSVGTAGQTSTIVAKIGDVAIHHNGGVGIDVRQNSTLTAPADCTGSNGCTGVTMLSNEIYANTGGGIRLRTAFIKRLLGGSEQRGFAGNSVFHNALNQCGGTQTAAQIVVDGPTGLANGDCTGLNVTECAEANIPTETTPNNQCVFLGSSCVVAWDLSSSPTSCGLANSFRDYDRSGAPEVNRKGAIFATNGARVLANNNNWPLQSPVENVDYSFSADGNTIIVAGQGCSSTGASCTEPPPAPAP